MPKTGPPDTVLVAESSIEGAEYDAVLLVAAPDSRTKIRPLQDVIDKAQSYDPSLTSELAVLPLSGTPSQRLIYSPTGRIDVDYDDARVLKTTAAKAVKRATKMGVKRPLVVLEEISQFENSQLITLLGVLEALYVPIQVRETDPTKLHFITHVGVFTDNLDRTKELISLASLLERGRRIACDIGEADPERMSPPRVEEYIRNIFENSSIQLTTVREQQQFAKEYPLFEAVNRAAALIQRHQGRIVYLEYNPPDPSKIRETLFLVGKGVTYDTGGIDVKINGAMVGMSRDKCGAAAVVGFMDIVNSLKPKDVRVVAGVSLVRNSIGSNGYVADEVITARSGARVRIGNTDAEGRMVMADVLCKMKEMALNAVNPHLFTIATLTGHAFLTVGEGFTIVMDNGPARKVSNWSRLQTAGDAIADPFEVSTIRSEDFQMHKGTGVGDDVKQANNLPSSRTPRGHQGQLLSLAACFVVGPAAFLLLASGLDKHGSSSDRPLKFTHLDIAGSGGEFPKPCTGAPILAMAKAYLHV